MVSKGKGLKPLHKAWLRKHAPMLAVLGIGSIFTLW